MFRSCESESADSLLAGEAGRQGKAKCTYPKISAFLVVLGRATSRRQDPRRPLRGWYGRGKNKPLGLLASFTSYVLLTLYSTCNDLSIATHEKNSRPFRRLSCLASPFLARVLQLQGAYDPTKGSVLYGKPYKYRPFV